MSERVERIHPRLSPGRPPAIDGGRPGSGGGMFDPKTLALGAAALFLSVVPRKPSYCVRQKRRSPGAGVGWPVPPEGVRAFARVNPA